MDLRLESQVSSETTYFLLKDINASLKHYVFSLIPQNLVEDDILKSHRTSLNKCS